MSQFIAGPPPTLHLPRVDTNNLGPIWRPEVPAPRPASEAIAELREAVKARRAGDYTGAFTDGGDCGCGQGRA